MNKYQIDLDHGEDEVVREKRNAGNIMNAKKEMNHDKQDSEIFPQKKVFHTHDDQENDLIEIHPKDWPEIPIKTVLLTLFLFIVGVGFSIGGITSYFSNSDGVKTLTFLLFGVFLTIPGAYYGVFLIQAYRATTPEDREEILDQIPM